MEILTALQWAKKGFIPNEGAKGTKQWTNRQVTALYAGWWYRFESCLFHTEKKILKRIIMGRIARKGFEYYRAETDRFRDIKAFSGNSSHNYTF